MVKLPAVSTQFLQYFMYETESNEPTDSYTNVSMMQQVQFHFLFDSLLMQLEKVKFTVDILKSN